MLKHHSALLAASLLIAGSALADTIAPTTLRSDMPYLMGDPAASQAINPGCNWQAGFFKKLAEKTDNRVRPAGTGEDGKTRTLALQANHSTQSRPASKGAPHWLEISGSLSENGKATLEFSFMSEATSGSLQSCSTLEDLSEELADDIADWLEHPAPAVRVAAVMPMLAADTVDPDIEQSCPLSRKLPQTLAEESETLVQRSSRDINQHPGRTLHLQVVSTRITGGGLYTGSKWVKVVGSLRQDQREIGNFIALRHSFRAWTACGMVGRLSDEISADIIHWLRNPTLNARLGDADESTTAEP